MFNFAGGLGVSQLVHTCHRATHRSEKRYYLSATSVVRASRVVERLEYADVRPMRGGRRWRPGRPRGEPNRRFTPIAIVNLPPRPQIANIHSAFCYNCLFTRWLQQHHPPWSFLKMSFDAA